MKKIIAAIWCAVLFSILIPSFGVLAESEAGSEGLDAESEYVYTGLGNKVKRKDEELAQKYQQGITMEPEQVQARKERVEELELEEYVDDRYFLLKEYYRKYSINELEQKGLMLLMECMTEQDLLVWEQRLKSGIAPRYITTDSTLLAWTDSTGATVRTHVFDVDGHIAFCGDHDKTAPITGTAHSSYIAVTNTQIQKFLYYGYGGPEDQMTKLGYARAKSYCLMAFSIDKLRNGERLGTSGTIFWDKIKDLPAPSKGNAYYVETYEDNLQDLFFYSMPTKGKLQITKKSADTNVITGNGCYSLAGAEYGVYTNSNGVSGYVTTLKTGSGGVSQEVELDAGTYYLKELKAPPGFALDTTVHEVAITAERKSAPDFKDMPQTNSIGILLAKVDADTNQNQPQGSGTLQGAQFTVKFYGGLWEKDMDPAALNQTPLRTWVFATDEEGSCKYSEEYLVSGDELFVSTEGRFWLPLGTVTIQETKASEGYLINPIMNILQITSQGTAETVHTYNKPTIPEHILKLNLIKKQDGKDIVIPDAEFEHMRPDGTTETMCTNEGGELTFSGLQYGVHQLKELSVMDGYEINGNVITFTVNEENAITLDSEINNLKGNATFEVTEEGNISIEMEDKVSSFRLLIHKINDKNAKLDGAEFTLYEDRECKTEITGGVTGNGGGLCFENLETEKKYYLKETKAPVGYRLPADIFGNPVIYEVYVESIPVKDEFIFYVNGVAYDVNSDSDGIFTVAGNKKEREVNMIIENKTGKLLPNAGSALTCLLLILGSLCILTAFGYAGKGKRGKKWRAVLLFFVMAAVFSEKNPVFAAGTAKGVVDFGQGNASITITGNAEQTLVGKKFNIYKLFHEENALNNESVNYTIHAPFESALKTVVGKRVGKSSNLVTEYEVIDYVQTLNTTPVEGAQIKQKPEASYSDFRYFIEALRDEIVKEGIAGEVVNVTSVCDVNSIVIGGLTYGYYIVDEVTTVDGRNQAASLCMVNTANPKADVNVKSDYPSVGKKIQEDDNRNTIGEGGWNDMADFEIGQTVPYKFISNVPDMNGYGTYYYAWHDRMDAALTFKPETVSISIHNGDMGDSYTLKKTEYAVITEPDNGETFKIEITDLKSIVDREFDNMNHLKENIYGQEVILRYDAVLNDSAAYNTGRPGFENDVKLEFSNNPDRNGYGQTGETPWDTVVCFTYKLNGVKVNNHGLKLEGAKFRLYSDEKCENEVYVRKAENGYHVMNRDSLGGSDHKGGETPENAVEIVSAENGVFTIAGLDGGTYWLKETEAPAGYRPVLEPIKVEVIPTFVENRDFYVKGDGASEKALKRLEFAARIRTFFDGAADENTMELETDVEEGAGNITIVNKVGKQLPTAGSSGMFFMMGAGILITIYALIRKKGENRRCK